VVGTAIKAIVCGRVGNFRNANPPLSLAAYQTCCRTLRRPDVLSALSGASVISRVSASFNIADFSAIAFSRNGPSSPSGVSAYSFQARCMGVHVTSAVYSMDPVLCMWYKVYPFVQAYAI